MAQIGGSPKNNQDKKKSTNVNENVDALSIPAAGVEPARPCGHRILSPARLPIPPRRHN